MSEKIKTFGDAVKQVKRLYSTLGIEYWEVYLSEVGRYYEDILHSENSEDLAYPGMMFQTNTCLIINDSFDAFILKEDFLFVLQS